MWALETEPGSSEEQSVFLIAEPSAQPHGTLFLSALLPRKQGSESEADEDKENSPFQVGHNPDYEEDTERSITGPCEFNYRRRFTMQHLGSITTGG